MPGLMVLARQIDRFGFAAISDRPLRGGEVAAIAHAERIVRAVEARSAAESVLRWEAANEQDAALLARLDEAFGHDVGME